jgi:hypothetical protein
MEMLLEIAKTWGMPAAVIAFFIWRDYDRETKMTKRIQEVEDYVRQTLTGLIANSMKSNDELKAANLAVLEELKRRPCQYTQPGSVVGLR